MNEFPQPHPDEAAIRALLAPLRDVEAVQPAPDVARDHLAAMLALGEQQAAARANVHALPDRPRRISRISRRMPTSMGLAAAACAVFAMVAVGTVNFAQEDSPIRNLTGDTPHITIQAPDSAPPAAATSHQRTPRHANARRGRTARPAASAASSIQGRSRGSSAVHTTPPTSHSTGPSAVRPSGSSHGSKPPVGATHPSTGGSTNCGAGGGSTQHPGSGSNTNNGGADPANTTDPADQGNLAVDGGAPPLSTASTPVGGAAGSCGGAH